MKYDFEHLDEPINYAVLAGVIRDSIEDIATPTAVRDYLLDHEGELLTVRHAKALTALIGHDVRIRKAYGMTKIEWSQPTKAPREGGVEKFSMLLAYSEKNVVIPGPKWFVEYCARELSAARTRNEQRRVILEGKVGAGSTVIDRMVVAIRAYRAACDEIKSALDCNDDDEDYSKNPDDCTINRLFILEDK